jgi:hypothetical protein
VPEVLELSLTNSTAYFSGKPPGDKTSNQAQAEFDGDSLSAGQKADSATTEVVSPNDEVAAFVNKKRSG